MTSIDGAGAVLFDIDGTLVDSNYLHVVAWLEAFHAVGHPVDAARIHRAIGMGSGQLLERLLGKDLAEEVGARAKEGHSARYRSMAGLLRPFDRAPDLLHFVAGRATVVLATSASSEELSALRRVLDSEDAISAVTSAADVETAKPTPDVVAGALRRADVLAERALFVGDTVWDIEAARRAGVRCIAVMSGGICRAELLAAGALAVYRDAGHLLDEVDESPLAPILRPAS